MLKKQFYFVFGFVFVFVAGQQRPSRPPKPPTLSGGSYSDYPGLFVNKNPIKTNIQQNFQNNVFSPRVSSDSGSSNVVRKPLGPIVIPAASSSYRSLPSNASPQVAPSQTSASSSIPRSGKGIPVSVVAAAELSQQNEKPKTPLKTGTDTWTPIGFTGDGKSFEISTARPSQGSNKAAEKTQVVTPQPVPYDTTVSKKTIGQQIIERQQQQPQQYDIFGFPIDNSPGKSQHEALQNPGLFEVVVSSLDMQSGRNRLRRHAILANPNGIIEPNKHFYPPKPPKDLPMPVRRRPPPPPPLQEEMFQGQHETVQPKTKSKPGYSGVSPTPSKKKVNNKSPTKDSKKKNSVTTTAKPSTKTPLVKKKDSKVNKASKVIETKPRPPVKSKKTKKVKPETYVKSNVANKNQRTANTLELGESPKEALNAEASLEFNALISGGAEAASEIGHTHEHATHDHSHAHAHTHPKPQQPKPSKTYDGPPAEMKAKFSSMFNAWYKAKFGTPETPTIAATTSKPKNTAGKSKQTKQPMKKYTVKKTGPVTKSMDKNALFEEFMTMFERQLGIGQIARPTTKYPGKVTFKPVVTQAPTPAPTVAKKDSTKAIQQKKSSSKQPAASYEKSPNAKFGPRKKNDYMKPTTQTTTVKPIVKTTVAANDPTLIELVTLSHPESLVYPLDQQTNQTNNSSSGNSNMTSLEMGANQSAQNTGIAGGQVPLNKEVITRNLLRTTTMRPTPDPDLVADINELRVNQGLPEVQAHQLDAQGNLLPFYKRQMRMGRFPARPHPLHNPGGLHHQLQHQHEVPHYHPEQGLGAGFNSFHQLFYPQPTNNGAVMAYEPFPRPNMPVPTTAAPKPLAAATKPTAVNMAPLPMVDAGQLNPLAYFYFFSALNNLLQPQNNGRYQQLFRNNNGLYNHNLLNNGLLGSNAFSQLAQSHASSQNQAQEPAHAAGGQHATETNGQIHGELSGVPNSLDLHHQAIHMEAGNAMTPHLHRQVHRLLRNRELNRQRGNMFGMQNFPVTPTPFIDPDIYADMMEAQAAALAG